MSASDNRPSRNESADEAIISFDDAANIGFKIAVVVSVDGGGLPQSDGAGD